MFFFFKLIYIWYSIYVYISYQICDLLITYLLGAY